MYSQKGTPYNEGPHRCRASIKGTLQLLLQYHLNPLPLSLFGNEEAVRELNMASLRLSFTREGKEETQKILEAFAASFIEGREIVEPVKDFTRGHFRRGVE